MQSIGERIRAIRECKALGRKLSQEKFARRIGTTAAAISRYESGLRGVPASIILSICREFGVNREWLETGEGEMRVATRSQTLESVARRYSQSPIFRAMLDAYAQMNEDEQAAIERYAALLAQNLAAPAQDSPTAEELQRNAEALMQILPPDGAAEA